MADTQTTVVRIELDRPRKLKCKHRHIRDAVRESGRSITDLLNDPFGGYPYVLRALLLPGAQDESITIDRASDLIDIYLEKNKSIEGLSRALVQALQAYLHIEAAPVEGDEDQAPNAGAPASPGPSGGDSDG
jgi:hypothetical protein